MEKNSALARIEGVDALRGAIIIIMALDHVRDFSSAAAMSFSPTDLSRTTAPLFFTRWITHFCPCCASSCSRSGLAPCATARSSFFSSLHRLSAARAKPFPRTTASASPRSTPSGWP